MTLTIRLPSAKLTDAVPPFRHWVEVFNRAFASASLGSLTGRASFFIFYFGETRFVCLALSHLPRVSGPLVTLPLTVPVDHESLGVVHWSELQQYQLRVLHGQ